MEAVVPPEGPENKGPFSIKVATSRSFARTAKTIPGIGPAEDLVKAAFDGISEPKVFTINNDFFVVQSDTRNQPSEEEFAKLKDGIKDKLLSMKQSILLAGQIKSLREKAESEGKIKILYKPQSSSAKDVTDMPPTPADEGKTDKKAKKAEKSEKKADKTAAETKSGAKEGENGDNEEAAEPEGE
jgi:hypothetical protein